jgi:hypothetical protein
MKKIILVLCLVFASGYSQAYDVLSLFPSKFGMSRKECEKTFKALTLKVSINTADAIVAESLSVKLMPNDTTNGKAAFYANSKSSKKNLIATMIYKYDSGIEKIPEKAMSDFLDTLTNTYGTPLKLYDDDYECDAYYYTTADYDIIYKPINSYSYHIVALIPKNKQKK